MELIAGFFLWIADVSGIKWVREETKVGGRIARFLIFLVAGILVVLLTFTLIYS
jgi:hypothetical protein